MRFEDHREETKLPVLTRDGEVVLVCSSLVEAIKAEKFYAEEFPDHVWEVAS